MAAEPLKCTLYLSRNNSNTEIEISFIIVVFSYFTDNISEAPVPWTQIQCMFTALARI